MTETHAGVDRRGWLLGAAIVVVAVATAWSTRVSEGRHLLAGAASAVQRGDETEAIVLARAAAEARCPFCEAPDLACGLLDAIAKQAEARGADATAVAAWRAVRAATLETSVFRTDTARLRLADAEIARLEHRIDVALAAATGGVATPVSEEKLRAALAANSVPSTAVFVLSGLGAILFLIGAVRFVRARSFATSAVALALAGGALAAVGILLF